MIDSLIKQQTAWSQGSSKYQKQKKYSRSEISINLSFYVYIIPKRNNYSSNSNKKLEAQVSLYFKHILLFNKKQLDRTQVSQLRNVFSNTYMN